ncbi:MAG TPA: polymer-forming cytoskeletal protein [Desulfobacterales bacterium]|nr:polymer-forming cytoskeletal protein [Desulfobacterales bacterium]
MLNKRRGTEREPTFSSDIPQEENVSYSSSPPVERKTIIGEHISIEGSIHGKESLIIEGAMKGKIELEKNQITVGTKGRVEAEIHADNVTISGRLTGNIKALGKVSITKGANFTGEIKAKSISVEDGAYLKAAIELEQEPQKGIPPDAKPASQGVKPVPSFEKKPVIPGADPIKKN